MVGTQMTPFFNRVFTKLEEINGRLQALENRVGALDNLGQQAGRGAPTQPPLPVLPPSPDGYPMKTRESVQALNMDLADRAAQERAVSICVDFLLQNLRIIPDDIPSTREVI
jgi:hypothetical protein